MFKQTGIWALAEKLRPRKQEPSSFELAQKLPQGLRAWGQMSPRSARKAHQALAPGLPRMALPAGTEHLMSHVEAAFQETLARNDPFRLDNERASQIAARSIPPEALTNFEPSPLSPRETLIRQKTLNNLLRAKLQSERSEPIKPVVIRNSPGPVPCGEELKTRMKTIMTQKANSPPNLNQAIEPAHYYPTTAVAQTRIITPSASPIGGSILSPTPPPPPTPPPTQQQPSPTQQQSPTPAQQTPTFASTECRQQTDLFNTTFMKMEDAMNLIYNIKSTAAYEVEQLKQKVSELEEQLKGSSSTSSPPLLLPLSQPNINLTTQSPQNLVDLQSPMTLESPASLPPQRAADSASSVASQKIEEAHRRAARLQKQVIPENVTPRTGGLRVADRIASLGLKDKARPAVHKPATKSTDVAQLRLDLEKAQVAARNAQTSLRNLRAESASWKQQKERVVKEVHQLRQEVAQLKRGSEKSEEMAALTRQVESLRQKLETEKRQRLEIETRLDSAERDAFTAARGEQEARQEITRKDLLISEMRRERDSATMAARAAVERMEDYKRHIQDLTAELGQVKMENVANRLKT